MRFWSAMVSQFCVRPTSKRLFLKIVQVTMKRYLFDVIVGIYVDFTSILHSLAMLVPLALCEANLNWLCPSTNESA